MDGMNSRFFSIEQAAGLYFNNAQNSITKAENTENSVSFEEIFKQASEKKLDVKFSKHANQRLASRNISLSSEQINRLNQGVEQARNKSINESLVMLDNMAFIVNIKNNTVVTALEKDNENNVFTNIDGAVIV